MLPEVPRERLEELFLGYLDSEAYDNIRVSLIALMQQAYQAGWTAAEDYHNLASTLSEDIYPSDAELEKMLDEIEDM